jgi:hypothetical protein
VPVVRATPLAEQQIATLTRRDRTRFNDFVLEPGRQGCAALAYRLSGTTPIDHICVKHLCAELRVAVLFESLDLAWILTVARHLNDSTLNVYTELYRVLSEEPGADAGRTKPPCCDEIKQMPSVLGEQANQILARAAVQRRRTRGR